MFKKIRTYTKALSTKTLALFGAFNALLLSLLPGPVLAVLPAAADVADGASTTSPIQMFRDFGSRGVTIAATVIAGLSCWVLAYHIYGSFTRSAGERRLEAVRYYRRCRCGGRCRHGRAGHTGRAVRQPKDGAIDGRARKHRAPDRCRADPVSRLQQPRDPGIGGRWVFWSAWCSGLLVALLIGYRAAGSSLSHPFSRGLHLPGRQTPG